MSWQLLHKQQPDCGLYIYIYIYNYICLYIPPSAGRELSRGIASGLRRIFPGVEGVWVTGDRCFLANFWPYGDGDGEFCCL